MTGDARKRTAIHREVRRLAATIRDQEQLDQIVSDAKPDMRNAVRGMLGRYVKFDLAAEEQSHPLDEMDALISQGAGTIPA